MRVKVDFDKLEEDTADRLKENGLWDLVQEGIWLNDFPCRLHIGDVILPDVFGERWRYFDGDNAEVHCLRFDIDECGIYQHVWCNEM